MIQFRCWYCNRRFAKSEDQIGQSLVCSCKQRLRVPKKSGGSSRNRTVGEWAIEFAVYGGGGGILGFFLAIVILSQMARFRFGLGIGGWGLVLTLTAIGLILGGFGGERGINWIGRQIRNREDR
jgi:hypothetical protein